MLQPDEVDADFFTPIPGSSLASIFSNINNLSEDGSSTSVKNVSQQLTTQADNNNTKAEVKATECVFAAVVSAYEWLDHSYVLREHLGFAIIKTLKDGSHQLVIYDSGKVTLSLAMLTSKFIVNVRKDVSVSYYDNLKKFWLISASPVKIKKIIEHLDCLNVNIKYSLEDNISPKDIISVKKDKIPLEIVKDNQNERESDTDSSVNRRTKDSIIKRMASMGHSVLPLHALKQISSDESADSEKNLETFPRHKPVKNLKKNTFDKTNELKIKDCNDSPTKLFNVQDVVDANNLCGNTLFGHSYQNCDINGFMSDQKEINIELRVNIRKITEKLDYFLDKAEHINLQSSPNNQSDIVSKLIKEYETKITAYENFIKSRGISTDPILTFQIGNINPDNVNNKLEIDDLNKFKSLCEQKSLEIVDLKENLQVLQDTHSKELDKCKLYEIIMQKEINDLKENLNAKNEHLENLNRKLNELSVSPMQLQTNVKKIMNNAYQIISDNFEDDNNYLGVVVKKTVAGIIKRTTVESLGNNIENHDSATVANDLPVGPQSDQTEPQ